MADSRERFSPHAAAYVAGRPDYPAAALAALFEGLSLPGAPVVADLGAGTGISARALARAGARVFAIEPSAAMRAAAAPDPNVTWIGGRAEATALPGASVDVAVALQAWHWFAHDAAFAECRRIVRPGGRIAVVYYERDERDAATEAYGDLVRRFAVDDAEARRAAALALFRALPGATSLEFADAQVLDSPAFAARIGSTSYLPQAGEAAERLREAAAALFRTWARDGALTLRLTVSVAYATAAAQ